MILASSDPLNLILVTIWSVTCFAAGTFGWVAYIWWKCEPTNSISQTIARWGLRQQDNFRIALLIGLMLGYGVGTVCGFFLGHFAWPVEIVMP